MCPVNSAAVFRPINAFSVPCRNEKLTLTTSPRFSFGKSATLTPFARVSLVVRLSIFPGVGSNASPAATTFPPA